MVTISNSFRNLTQQAGNISPGLAAAVDAVTHRASPKSHAANLAVDALSDLLNNNAMDSDNALIIDVSRSTDRYETYGYPDRMAQLYALIKRPVGQGVHYSSRTATVDTPDGPVTTTIESAEYYTRPLTPEEIAYLDQEDRLKRLRPKPGDIDWITKPKHMRAI